MTILVIDVGSSSARALLFDHQAECIPGAVACAPYQMTTTPSGAATFDPLELRRQVETCIDTILQHPAAVDIQAVGMATFVGNVLGVDAVGRPLTPIYTYADTRSAEDVEFLRTVIDLPAKHQRTGCTLHTAY